MKTLSVKANILLIATLLAGPSWADNVVNTITQGGSSNKAAVSQPGATNDNNEATILQSPVVGVLGGSSNNLAQINQVNNAPSGPTQNAVIFQGAGQLDLLNVPHNPGLPVIPLDSRFTRFLDDIPIAPPPVNVNNRAVTEQGVSGSGFANFSLTLQNGSDNVAYTRQDSGNNVAGIIQSGDLSAGANGMNAYINQDNSAGYDFAKIKQDGSSHKASIEQTSTPLGTTLGGISSGGGWNSAEISQTGNGITSQNNEARIVQTGYGNNSESDPARISQTGFEQRALIYQTGDDSVHASIEQGGGFNTAAIFQVKDGGLTSATHSADIKQGLASAGGGSDAHAIVLQSGGHARHVATVEQSGSAQTALVYQTQTYVSDHATVTQADTNNLGIVVQGDAPLNLFRRGDIGLDGLLSPIGAEVNPTTPSPGLVATGGAS